MPLTSHLFDPVVYAVIFLAVLLSAALWYYVFLFKPFARFPACRLEYRILSWIIRGRKLDIELFKEIIAMARKYETEGIYVLWFFRPVIVAFGEEIAKNLLPCTTDKPWTAKIFEFSFGKGIFVSNGDRWKRQKKILGPAFRPIALRSYVPFMNENARALVDKLSGKRGEAIPHLSHLLSECTIRLFYESSLGVRDTDSKKAEKFIKIIHRTSEFFVYRYIRPWLYIDFLLPFVPYAREILKLDAENRKMNILTIEKMKERVLASRESSQVVDDPLTTRPKTIGEIIIEDSSQLPSFSIEELARELHFLIFAGFDTTAHALMWILFALGLHPEIQDRVYDEIATLTEKDIYYADVREMNYLDCVIKESLRLYPVPLFIRTVNKDVQCGNYLIPRNTEVIIFSFMLHRNPLIYPDPEKFDPDRFMENDLKRKPWNYIPFAEGPRSCIGKNYAMLSMKIFLIHVLRNFKVISLDREEDLTFKSHLVLTAEEDPRMKFIPRHDQP